MTGRFLRQHHVVYIPGLGDKKVLAQQIAVSTWRLYGFCGHCHPVGWSDDQSFDDKLKSVLQEIDELLSAGHIVSVMGSSAGASMALHAYAARKRKLAGVAVICGALGDAANIRPYYFEENPAFKTSMERLPKTIDSLTPEDRQRIMSIHPLYDKTVPIRDTQVDGFRMFTTISFGHAFTIGITLTFDCYIPLWFLLKQARQRNK